MLTPYIRNILLYEAYDQKTDDGSIINIASGAGLEGVTTMAAYVTSKHVIIGITKSAALEDWVQKALE
ncbi:hypothetical protein DEX24_12170 [Kurthia sibirica]|uniref:Uncharacterized protein n=2 Tax=Kurthia sibirica TaxID=202750 RepID=A0A2U3AJS7_9BACL|nr:hypothetical protein DEX24_12170 [Kurthia sibirica]